MDHAAELNDGLGASRRNLRTTVWNEAQPSPEFGAAEEDLSSAVHAARHGDEDAFRLLYREVQPRLLRYLYTLVGEDAEDVAAEAWLQIARDLDSFTGNFGGFRGWAATIARNRALDHLRRLSRRPVADVPIEQIIGLAGSEDTAAYALDAVSTDAAIALIASLPRDQAEAVLLRVVVGLDAQSAGRVLGKRAGAVRTAAHRGLRRLARQLQDASSGRDTLARRGGPIRRGVRTQSSGGSHWRSDANDGPGAEGMR